MYKDDPKFTMMFESKIFNINGDRLKEGDEPLRYYSLTNMSEYHMSRHLAASAQNMYSAAGITPTVINSICDQMIQAVNDKKIVDVAVLANNLKYRTKYPVDEHATLRMAMIYSIVEREDPDKCENHWTEWKLKRILDEPEAYSFFLPIGLELTPAYSEYLQEVSLNSLNQRKTMLESMQPSTSEQK
ncbi:hypothetical protein EGI16_03475 [Chryseobacterium sp. G0240]|uniref:hypothetical protein n=1 Tax=Chryseobacterium sp. G0240 TaxID=2487066 RepID=UPI000F45E7E7|nr:hypothetical protein [Chryseobacterium sp. G0240]ROI05460.1 hypothetical protein EGI16_03475 [Chryseobacterium sp. G0240]